MVSTAKPAPSKPRPTSCSAIQAASHPSSTRRTLTLPGLSDPAVPAQPYGMNPCLAPLFKPHNYHRTEFARAYRKLPKSDLAAWCSACPCLSHSTPLSDRANRASSTPRHYAHWFHFRRRMSHARHPLCGETIWRDRHRTISTCPLPPFPRSF